MFRSRAALSVLLVATAPLVIAGCSGKPENSPAIRKKFAEYDKALENNTRLSNEVARLSAEIARISQENSELRALAPDIDGSSVVAKISTLESRLARVESQSADRAVAAAATTTTSTRPASTTTAASTTTRPSGTLDSAPLATEALSPRPVVAAQQASAARQSSTPPSNSFRAMTNPSAAQQPSAAPAPRTAPAQRPAAPAASAPARPAAQASAPSTQRGGYHTITAGETLEGVAAKYGTTVQAIQTANRLPAGARIAQGQRLFIPPAKQ
jgi:LysM repeat protein